MTQLTLTLNLITAQVAETSVNVKNNSPILRTTGFKPHNIFINNIINTEGQHFNIIAPGYGFWIKILDHSQAPLLIG